MNYLLFLRFFTPFIMLGPDEVEAFIGNGLQGQWVAGVIATPWNKGCFQMAANLEIESCNG
jgi:hypothetical protein